MKSFILFLPFLLLFACKVEPEKIYIAKTSPFVSDSIWGSPFIKIEKGETFRMVSKKVDTLMYAGNTNITPSDSLVSYITYYFRFDKLNKISYLFHFIPKSDNEYVIFINKMFSTFDHRYGKPGSFSKRWDNKMYANDSTMFGRALKLGHVTLYSDWNTKLTKIKCVVWTTPDGELIFALQYFSKEYADPLTLDNE